MDDFERNNFGIVLSEDGDDLDFFLFELFSSFLSLGAINTFTFIYLNFLFDILFDFFDNSLNDFLFNFLFDINTLFDNFSLNNNSLFLSDMDNISDL